MIGNVKMDYHEFIKSKSPLAKNAGLAIDNVVVNPMLKTNQKGE